MAISDSILKNELINSRSLIKPDIKTPSRFKPNNIINPSTSHDLSSFTYNKGKSDSSHSLNIKSRKVSVVKKTPSDDEMSFEFE